MSEGNVRLPELVNHAQELIDAGVLTKHDESFVTTTTMKFERGHHLDSFEISRLREIVSANQ